MPKKEKAQKKGIPGIAILVMIAVLTVMPIVVMSLSRTGAKTIHTAAYLKDLTGPTVSLNFVEYVTDEDVERKESLIQELGLTEGDDLCDGNFLDGYYIYDEKEEYVTYPVSDDAQYHFIDWGRDFIDSDMPEDLAISTTDSKMFMKYLETYEDAAPGMPFFIEIKNGKVISITEKPMP